MSSPFPCNTVKKNTASKITLYMSLQETSTRQKELSFLEPKISTKMSQNAKNVKITASFTHDLKRRVLSKLFT